MAKPRCLVPLPRDEWMVRRCGPDHVVIGMHTNDGAIYWTEMAASELPEDLIVLDDLESLVIEPIDVPAV
jgi:hypothetical protein